MLYLFCIHFQTINYTHIWLLTTECIQKSLHDISLFLQINAYPLWKYNKMSPVINYSMMFWALSKVTAFCLQEWCDWVMESMAEACQPSKPTMHKWKLKFRNRIKLSKQMENKMPWFSLHIGFITFSLSPHALTSGRRVTYSVGRGALACPQLLRITASSASDELPGVSVCSFFFLLKGQFSEI